MEYDIRGNKTKMNDPDMGTWTYSYNALGKLVSQTDAKGQTSTMVYVTDEGLLKIITVRVVCH
jgi:YD repeat-containing protein